MRVGGLVIDTLVVESRALGAQREEGMGRGGADLVSLLFPAVFLRPLFLSRLGLSAAPADPSCLTAPRSYKPPAAPLALRPEHFEPIVCQAF
jgi:hypothetical protein